jgi:D-sedoheptulose 7-phosphate isomerase
MTPIEGLKPYGKRQAMNNFSYNYIQQLKEVLDAFPHHQFNRFYEVLIEAYEKEKHIFIMGNGGSGSTASHWVCDINKECCIHNGKRFKMISLTDNIPTMLAYGNDLSYEDIFLEQLINFFIPGDVVIGISGSGNSVNVIKAIEYANANGGITVGLCGYSGGTLLNLVQIPLHIPVADMQKTEDVHLIVGHIFMQRFLVEMKKRIKDHMTGVADNIVMLAASPSSIKRSTK